MPGTNNVVVEGVTGRTFTLSSSTNLLTAAAEARAGDVVVLDTVVPGFRLDLANPKGAAGVDVVLPASQPVQITSVTAAPLNMRVHRGVYTKDVAGPFTDEGVSLLGCSRVGLFSGSIYTSGTGISLADCTDVDVRHITDNGGHTGDMLHLGGNCSRLRFDDVYARAQESYALTFNWSPDGSLPPIDGGAIGKDAQSGYVWSDTSHQDVLQPNNNTVTSDYTVTNFDVETLGQGVVSFGGTTINRGYFGNNRLIVDAFHALTQDGNDLTVVDNVIGRISPSNFSGSVTMNINTARPGPRVQGKGNSGTGAVITGPAGVNLQAATLNGDSGVIIPELPRLARPAWMPSFARPALVPVASPTMVTKPKLYWGNVEPAAGANPTAGQVLSSRPGAVLGFKAAVGVNTIYESYYKVSGLILPGETARRFDTAGRAGQTVILGMRAVVDGVPTPWMESDPVTIQ